MRTSGLRISVSLIFLSGAIYALLFPAQVSEIKESVEGAKEA
jgi:hypothetical protein